MANNKPWRFLMKNARDFKLAFNSFPANIAAHKRGSFIGSAVFLLESLKQGLVSECESLIKDFTTPILEKHTLEFIGRTTIYFLVVTLFEELCLLPELELNLDFW